MPNQVQDLLVDFKIERIKLIRTLGNSFEPEGKLVEGIRDEDPEKGTEERKKRLEKKRGHKVDDHPEYAKESATPGQPAEKLKTGRKMFTIPDEERSALLLHVLRRIPERSAKKKSRKKNLRFWKDLVDLLRKRKRLTRKS